MMRETDTSEHRTGCVSSRTNGLHNIDKKPGYRGAFATSAGKSALRPAAGLILALILSLSTPFGVFADTISDLEQQLGQKEQEKDRTEDALQDTRENLDDLKTAQSGLKGQLNSLNTKLTEVSDNLADLEVKLEIKSRDIDEAEALLQESIATEEAQYESMKARIRFMYESGEQTYMELLFSSETLAGFLNRADYIEKLEAYDRRMLEEFKATRVLVEETRARLENEKADLESLKQAAAAEQAKVQGLVTQTSVEVKKYAGAISQTEEEAEAYEAMIAKQESDIAALRKQIAEEKEKSRLAAQSTWRDISDIQFAEGDRYLLANLIYCEAGNQPYEGQVGVGAVVINRVRSAVYPDTVVGVIYQNRQFSPVASGRLALALAENRASAACYQAADAAMQGQTTVGNCVYFRTPIPGLTGLQIGGHIFY